MNKALLLLSQTRKHHKRSPLHRPPLPHSISCHLTSLSLECTSRAFTSLVLAPGCTRREHYSFNPRNMNFRLLIRVVSTRAQGDMLSTRRASLAFWLPYHAQERGVTPTVSAWPVENTTCGIPSRTLMLHSNLLTTKRKEQKATNNFFLNIHWSRTHSSSS